MSARSGAVKQVLLVTALVVGVTVGGVAAGAFLVSPRMKALVAATKGAITSERLAVGAGVLLLGFLLTVLTPRITRALRKLRARGRRGSTPRTVVALPEPAVGRSDRTPRAVQALAQQGARPTEIAWRTGLPVDAVSLLLAMSTASRQLQPPTA